MSAPLTAYVVGGDTLLVQCAELWLEAGHRLNGVFSDAPAVLSWASERGVTAHPVAAASGDGGSTMARIMAEDTADYLLAITHLDLLPDAVLAAPRLGAINFHDGPLPRYAGLNAPSWALRGGEREHGVTWHYITRGVDQGDVLVQQALPIGDTDTAFTLNARCFEAGMESFAQLLRQLEAARAQGTRPRGTAQNLAQRTVFKRYDRPERAGLLDFTAAAEVVSRAVRSLDFGAGYNNPVATAKMWLGSEWVVVAHVAVADSTGGTSAGASPGQIVALDGDTLTVGTASDPVSLSGWSLPCGAALTAEQVLGRAGLALGGTLPAVAADSAAKAEEMVRRWAPAERLWRQTLAQDEALSLGDAPHGVDSQSVRVEQPVPAHWQEWAGRESAADRLLAAVCLFLTRRAGRTGLVGLRTDNLARELSRDPVLEALFASYPPLAVPRPTDAAKQAVDALALTIAGHHQRGSYLLDTTTRAGRGAAPVMPVSLERVDAFAATVAVDGGMPLAGGVVLHICAADDAACLVWTGSGSAFTEPTLRAFAGECAAFLAAMAAEPERAVSTLPLMDDATRQQVLVEWNRTERSYNRDATVHGLIRAQARRTPDAVALVHRDRQLTYAEFDRCTDRIAAELQALGAAPGQRVGLCTSRGVEMVAGMVGIMKSGAAYVPLDPAYPADRLAYMVADAGIGLLVVNGAAATQCSHLTGIDGMQVLDVSEHALASTAGAADDSANSAANSSGAAAATADDLAYVIYTSGSTGKPKGVMVQHRNAVNFFAGMDDRLVQDADGDRTWCAVTSPSFDISVLELLYTLGRGFKVVVADGIAPADSSAGPAGEASRPCTFSLFYFASDEGGAEGAAKYRLLLDGARFADQNGFEAVWMPERHFHAFGGLYPNPSVAAAAVASITERVKIRSGSVVMPLHHPIRVAEEWSLVDNLSQGRVGISFAAGWQPNDFVLMPQNFEDRKRLMYEGIAQVQSLWRGEEQTFPGPKGDVTVRTLPRPVQPELPTWVTIAGNPDTFREAGEVGANVLTHLLGQSTKELADKIAIYRKAWRDAGHQGEGAVTLMLHTFIGPDAEHVRATVREPMKGYLRSAMDLVKKAAWSFPTFKAKDVNPEEMMAKGLTEEESDALVEHAFERYYETSGLFGTPDQGIEFVRSVLALGVDEIGCLIDFGVPVQTALDHLPHLDQVRQAFPAQRIGGAIAPGSDDSSSEASLGAGARDDSIAALIERHGVTHLQCTPSMAGILVEDPGSRRALAQVGTVMVGGEALPTALARDLTATAGRILNMYGPTETTIWSSVSEVVDPERIAIGTPIANTQLFVLDDRQQPVPMGAPGELCIGGDGVVPGYLDRPELTAERFVPDPFAGAGRRMYRTGDLVRWRDDGVMEFLGRLDHQVKVRGHRIELGEIETALSDCGGIEQAVVIAREDRPGDVRLVGYVRASDGSPPPSEAALKRSLEERLPDFMVPAHIVALREFPQTPNRKVDRKALPAPQAAAKSGASAGAGGGKAAVPAADERERSIQALWEEALGVPVGVEDNFFDLGGHSLLAVRVQRMITERLGLKLSLTDLFRWPTVRALAHNTGGDGEGSVDKDAVAKSGSDRGARRRAMMTRKSR